MRRVKMEEKKTMEQAEMNHLTMERSAELMLSDDYRALMAAEWAREQALVMQEYMDILEKRAELEGIRLEAYFQ